VPNKALRAVQYALARGPLTFVREARHRSYTWYFERRLGVDTGGWIDHHDLDYRFADGKPYGPIGYEHVFWALDQIPFPAGQTELIDYGAGRGRAIIAAASRPFHRVTGVEMSPSLARDASDNVARMQNRRAAHVEVVQANALDFPIPATANVFYFFNPFAGEALRQMTGLIRQSIEAHPRPAFVIYFNPEHFDPLVANQPWIRRVFEGHFYPNYHCGLYRIG
jgi:16S rRNA G966 N2-methylase RsmD